MQRTWTPLLRDSHAPPSGARSHCLPPIYTSPCPLSPCPPCLPLVCASACPGCFRRAAALPHPHSTPSASRPHPCTQTMRTLVTAAFKEKMSEPDVGQVCRDCILSCTTCACPVYRHAVWRRAVSASGDEWPGWAENMSSGRRGWRMRSGVGACRKSSAFGGGGSCGC